MIYTYEGGPVDGRLVSGQRVLPVAPDQRALDHEHLEDVVFVHADPLSPLPLHVVILDQDL